MTPPASRPHHLPRSSSTSLTGVRAALAALLLLILASAAAAPHAKAANPAEITPSTPPAARRETNVLYRTDDAQLTEGMRERCRLDLSLPATRGQGGFPTVVWFHGGGLTGGQKSIPRNLEGHGLAIAAAGYRLSPAVKAPAPIEDAAAAVAWVFKNIEHHGGSPDRIYVAGHSAGGYLTSMLGLDKRWLAAHGIDANRIAGLIPYSGQCITHFTFRAERGIQGTQPVIDDLAPLYHVRRDAPPLLLITGDRNRELLGRYEENAYFWRMLKEAGHTRTDLLELQGYDHGGMAEPAHPLLLEFIRKLEQPRPAPNQPR